MKKISLGEVAKYINGRAFSPDEWGTIGLPIIRIQNLTGSSQLTNYYCGEFDKKHLVRRGDILISWSASLGVYIWAGNDAILNQHIFKVVPKESVDKLYFYYAASNALNEMISQVHGSTMQHITKDPFESTLIYLPSLPEQKRIAAILEKANRLRRQRRYAMELSDTYLQTVFLGMFGDPVTNPKGWIQERLGEKITYITSGSRGWAQYYSDKGAVFIRIQNVGRNQLLLNDLAYVQIPHGTEGQRTRVQGGDLLLSITADLGRTAVIPENFPEAYINQHLALLRLKDLNPVFVAGFISTPGGKAQITQLDRDGVKSGLNFDDIRGYQIFVPPISLQNKFAQVVQKYQRLRAQQREAERQAEHLFQTLLHRAFQGELELEKGAGDMPEEQAHSTNATDLQYALAAPAKLVAEEMAQLALPME